MKVLSAGYVGEDNPHELLVNNALKNLGVEVIPIQRKTWLPLLQAWFKHPEAKIVHLHWLEPFWLSPKPIKSWFKSLRFFFDLMAIKLLKVSVIWTIHNLHNHENRQLRLEQIVYQYATYQTNKILVHCPLAKQKVISKYRVSQEKVEVIEHCSYANYYPQTISQLEARTKLNVKKEETVFLFLGTMRPYKGLGTLIDAYKKLSIEKSRLIIAGWADSNQRSLLAKKIDNHPQISFYPQKIAREKVQLYFQAADFVVLPYKQILNSGSFFLAQTFSKPVIAPAIGCLSDNLDSKTGILYSSNKSLKEALQKALKLSSKERAIMEKHIKEKSQLNTPAQQARKTYQVYKQLIKT